MMYEKWGDVSNRIKVKEKGGFGWNKADGKREKTRGNHIGRERESLLLFSLLAATLPFKRILRLRDISKLDHPLPAPTIIYDQNGRVASKISASKMEAVSIERIPNHFLEAIVATEDRRFYDHEGIDYFGILRALVHNMKALEWAEGGSTITQQLAKNVFLTNEKTLHRKWEEWFIAKKIERTYSKKEILEMYVNRVYFGEGAWGIKKAAETYFGKIGILVYCCKSRVFFASL